MADLEATIIAEAESRSRFSENRDARMDAEVLLYLLFDERQDTREAGYSRFKTNWPMVVVDRARQMLTRNPQRFQIPLEESDREDRDRKSLIERWCKGLWSDINLRLRRQGWTMGADGIAASHLLLRGWCASELVLSEREQERRGSPVRYHWWDSRFVYPYWDDDGLNSVLYAVEARLGDVMLEYQDAPIEGDRNDTVKKYIWYDRNNYGVLAEWTPRKGRRSKQYTWLRPPFAHDLRDIPVVITLANQLPVVHLPRQYATSEDANNTGLTRIRRGTSTLTPAGLRGRGMLSAVTQAIPQFNEFMALLFHVVKAGAFGTWFYYSPDGGPRPIDIGMGEVNWATLGEKVERHNPAPPPNGLNEIMSALFREIQIGTIPGDLMAAFTSATSGFDRSQILAVAMNALGDYQDAMTAWAEELTQTALRQFAQQPFELLARGYDNRRTPFEMTIRGEDIDRYYDIHVKRQLALPEDLNGRLQAARVALDPAAPVLDPWTVLDEIMQVEDPDLILDKMWEWKAFNFPPILFNILKDALVRRGATPEQLQMVLTMEEAGKYMAEMQRLQGQGTVAQMQAALQGTGMNPSALPPEAAGSANIEGAGAPGIPVPPGAGAPPLARG